MDLLTISLAILACVIATCYLLCRNLWFFKGTGIPYKTPLPIVGNMASLFLRRKDVIEHIMEIYNIHKEARYIGFFSMHVPIIVIRDAELVKSLGVKNFEHFPNHQFVVDNTQDKLFSKNLFVLRGQKWKEVRALLSPFFTTMRIKLMFKLMTSCGHNFVNFLAELPEDKREVDILDAFRRYTTDVIASCAFGVQIDSLKDRDNDFFRYGKESSGFEGGAFIKFFIIQMLPRLANLLRLRVISKHIADFFQTLVKEIIETREKTGITRPDVLQMLMDSRGKEGRNDLSIEEMTSQAFFFFFAGFSTSSTSMALAAHLIGTYPEVQSRLREEIDAVLAANPEGLSYEAVNEMKYLDAVINESFRMYPVGFVTERLCEKEFLLPPTLPGVNPYLVKPGTLIWFPTLALQRDPRYFEDPDTFNPDRFLGEGKKVPGTGEFLPFGIGPRMCIANRFAMLEMKVVIFYLLARCELKPSPKTSIPLKMSKSRPMEPENGFWLRVEPRADSLLVGNAKA